MTKPSAWRAFLRPAGHRLPETSCAGRAPHGLSQPPDMPDRDRSTPYRPPRTASAFPAKAAPSRSIPARVSDRPVSPRRSGPTTRQQASGSPTSPSGIAARYPQTRLHFPTSAQDGALHEERPALRRACSHYQRAPPTDPPLYCRKAPSHTSRGIPVARKQARARKRKNSGIFSPQLSPSLLFPAP